MVRIPFECPGYETKQSDGEALEMLVLWEVQSNFLSPSLPGPLSPGVVAFDSILFMGQIELNSALLLNGIVWNITVFVIETVK